MGAGQPGSSPLQSGPPDSDHSEGSDPARGTARSDVDAPESESFEGPDSTDSEPSDHEQ